MKRLKPVLVVLALCLAGAILFLAAKAVITWGFGPKVPDEPGALYRHASVAMSKGDYTGAVADLVRLVGRHGTSRFAEPSLFALARAYEGKGDFLRARKTLENVFERFPSSVSLGKAREELDRLNITILFSPVADDTSILYEVKSKDTLGKIAANFDTTVDLVMRSNSLKDNTIRPGKKLKVTKLTFSVIVDKSQNILTLLADGKVFKTYTVATGVNNCSPAGVFKVVTKVVDPIWYTQNAVVPAGSAKNILGTRWLGISKQGYGIHGAVDPATIGTQATAGCVRMHNKDVEELYTIVPVGTGVTIVD